ncbi:hypothetical protein like AT5G47940 [Hibiscus trionum]|uniref:Uncharacterized protein n=1 Tax=Hibiscus trionum TaxID=183268 RepID=A0A9W7LT68_HIBTR|nr:hypothetical protein like AT5G47940 [Hibiscus trionum]
MDSWKSSSNWSAAVGSLHNSVIFESTFASIAGCDQHDPGVDDSNAVDSAPNFPLILCPTSPDSGPCEITIAFAQSHEVRQVYVRSTARVYEIYCAPKPRSSNEYFCTVRCGVACRDEEVLQAANFDESALARLKGGNTKLDEKRLKSDSNSTSTEDDWVDVKAPDTPLLDSGSNVPSNLTVNSSSTQDLYEATAEINDANPCMSITLRLLSLQNKGCVCVDEIYVFADPVDIADSETEVGQMGNGGNSLMAMLAPTLLQLSKTAGLRHIENEEVFGTKKKDKKQENRQKAIENLNFRNETLQEVKPSFANQQDKNLQEELAATIQLNQHEIPPRKHGVPQAEVACGHTERFLNELVSRISRVEDLLLKFEENILKPISSIDARLTHVEQQLGELTKNPKNSELPTCTRFYAPEFSCHSSENYSSCNIGNESSVHEIYASHEKDISSTNQLDETICSINGTRTFPSIVVTAPDFSNDDDDDDEDTHASETGSPKKSVSIDVALASALANFLSSTSIVPDNYTQALAVKAPEFSLEEDGSIDKMVSPESHFRVTSEPCGLDSRDGKDSMTASLPSDCSLERVREVTCSPNDDDSKQTAKEVVEDCKEREPA